MFFSEKKTENICLLLLFPGKNWFYSHIQNSLENTKVISLGYHGDIMKNLLIGIYYDLLLYSLDKTTIRMI